MKRTRLASDDRPGGSVLGTFVDAIHWERAIGTIMAWASRRESRYVCACNVHVVMSMRRHRHIHQSIEAADMVTPDGMPVAWMLRRLGFRNQQRIDGPDLTWRLCAQAQEAGLPVFFYGSTPSTLDLLRTRLTGAFPRLQIAGMHAPPFRELTPGEDAQAVNMINQSGAGILFVGLGCPKQELWMSAHCGPIQCVMVGVGAAFDFHAGTIRRAPEWMRRSGLEWAYRLGTEPRRLWRRYLTTNVAFMIGALGQLLRSR